MKKYLLGFLALALLAGCSSAPRHQLMQNCKALGEGLYDCEETPKDINKAGGHKGAL